MVKKQSKNNKKSVFFCPECNSKNIETDFSNAALVNIGMVSNARVCKRCGYRNTFFPSAPMNKIPPLKTVSHIKKRELVNHTYASNVVWAWKIVSPLLWALVFFTTSIGYLESDKNVLLMSLFVLLPAAIGTTIPAFFQKEMKKYTIFRILAAVLIIWSLTGGMLIISLM